MYIHTLNNKNNNLMFNFCTKNNFLKKKIALLQNVGGPFGGYPYIVYKYIHICTYIYIYIYIY